MYNLKNVIMVLILLTFAVACSDSAQEPSVDESTTPSAEQYNDSEASSSSGDEVTAVCQSNPDYPCCCKLGGSRSCMTKSACADNGGKCTTNDAYGNCP